MKSKMDNSVKIALIAAGTIVFLALFLGFGIYLIANPSETVDVDGVSELKVMPDIATVYINIDTNGTTATIAKDKNSEIEEKVISALVAQGIERSKITTQNYNIYEDFDWTDEGRVSIGYKATHSIKVEMSSDKISLAGNVIDAAVNNGAIVSYINFELSQTKENEYKKQAITQATLDARAKAEGIADGLGMKIGKVVSVSTSDWGYRPWPVYSGMVGTLEEASVAKTAVTTIQPGEESVSASVSVTYKLV